ncbi:MAG: hypothetical protein ABSD71_08220 [Bacteroidales bacterium]|jgi:hypothetical protein
MNPDFHSFHADKLFSEFDEIPSIINAYGPSEFEAWLNRVCANIITRLIEYQKSLTQTEKEQLIKSALERINNLVLPSITEMSYSIIWNNVIKEFEAKLNSFLFILLLNSETTPIAAPVQQKIRFRIGTTVGVLAAQTRVNFESGLYQTTNKHEICRQVTSSYCTLTLPEIGRLSFKNLFDSPSIESLNQVESVLTNNSRLLRRSNPRSFSVMG